MKRVVLFPIVLQAYCKAHMFQNRKTHRIQKPTRITLVRPTLKTSHAAVNRIFDFDEAVKNITLFGSKISLPCTIEDFGEDYSLLETNLTTFGDISSCSILYQGKSIGTVSLIGYKNDGNLNDKKIVSLSLGFIAKDVGASDSLKEALYESRGWYNGLIEVDFAGLSFESTKVEVESLFGKPDNSDDDSADYKFYSNDQSNSVEVRFYQDKVKQIIVYMNGENNYEQQQ